MTDKPLYVCGSCKYSSPPFTQGDTVMVECRRNHPGADGFPIMQYVAWCWDGVPDCGLILTLEGRK